MPITVTAPRGELTEAGEREILPRLTAALVEASGLTGNSFFEPVVGGTVHLLDRRDVYAGGTNSPVVMVELKLPNIGLPDMDSRRRFIELATEIVDELSIAGHDPFHTWVNVLNAPDGAWGVGGKAWTGDELIEAITTADQVATP